MVATTGAVTVGTYMWYKTSESNTDNEEVPLGLTLDQPLIYRQGDRMYDRFGILKIELKKTAFVNFVYSYQIVVLFHKSHSIHKFWFYKNDEEDEDSSLLTVSSAGSHYVQFNSIRNEQEIIISKMRLTFDPMPRDENADQADGNQENGDLD